MLAVRRDSSSVLAAETRRFLVDKREMMELERWQLSVREGVHEPRLHHASDEE